MQMSLQIHSGVIPYHTHTRASLLASKRLFVQGNRVCPLPAPRQGCKREKQKKTPRRQHNNKASTHNTGTINGANKVQRTGNKTKRGLKPTVCHCRRHPHQAVDDLDRARGPAPALYLGGLSLASYGVRTNTTVQPSRAQVRTQIHALRLCGWSGGFHQTSRLATTTSADGGWRWSCRVSSLVPARCCYNSALHNE